MLLYVCIVVLPACIPCVHIGWYSLGSQQYSAMNGWSVIHHYMHLVVLVAPSLTQCCGVLCSVGVNREGFVWADRNCELMSKFPVNTENWEPVVVTIAQVTRNKLVGGRSRYAYMYMMRSPYRYSWLQYTYDQKLPIVRNFFVCMQRLIKIPCRRVDDSIINDHHGDDRSDGVRIWNLE